jgi:hypothetical protein
LRHKLLHAAVFDFRHINRATQRDCETVREIEPPRDLALPAYHPEQLAFEPCLTPKEATPARMSEDREHAITRT